jgi:hypothetical protein
MLAACIQLDGTGRFREVAEGNQQGRRDPACRTGDPPYGRLKEIDNVCPCAV